MIRLHRRPTRLLQRTRPIGLRWGAFLPLFCLSLLYAGYARSGSETVPTPLSLEDAWRIAYENNEALEIQREELFKAGNLKWKAAALVLPQISGNASWTSINTESEATFIVGDSGEGTDSADAEQDPSGQFSTLSYSDYYTTKSIGVSLTQPIFQGEAWPLYQQALANLDSQTAEENEIWGGIRLQVVHAYVGTLKAQGALETAQRQIERLGEHLKMADMLIEVGRGIQTDKLQAEVALQSARTQRRAAENGVALALENLYLAMGQRGDFSLSDPSESLITQLPALEVGLEQAIKSRGKAVSAKHRVEGSKQKHNQTLASFLPSAYFTGAYSHDENDALFGQKSDRWSATFNISVPIFEGGIRFANLREDSAGIRQAELAQRQIKNLIGLEVRSASLNMGTAEDLMTATQEEVRLAEAQYSLISERFRQGQGTSLDIKDAQTMLFEAEVKLMLHRYEWIESRFVYLQSIGELAKLEPSKSE